MFRDRLSKLKDRFHGKKKDESPFVVVPENHLTGDNLIPDDRDAFPEDTHASGGLTTNENPLEKLGSKRKLSFSRMKRKLKLRPRSLGKLKALFAKGPSKDCEIKLEESSPVSSHFSNEMATNTTEATGAATNPDLASLSHEIETLKITMENKMRVLEVEQEKAQLVLDQAEQMLRDLVPEVKGDTHKKVAELDAIDHQVCFVTSRGSVYNLAALQDSRLEEFLTSRTVRELRKLRKTCELKLGSLKMIGMDNSPSYIFLSERMKRIDDQIRSKYQHGLRKVLVFVHSLVRPRYHNGNKSRTTVV
ncbi:uncharacterized protein CANTADRAFT_8412 [Suhomyces tanzawaensis NRRL Y-17324]|uniref:Uncharacterized protein n=1 Tax=Suhomyces tanzawaensis NRRL Y-17324 TaxID=984487 RepID=A0A1E4SBE3_9ASCO|nr:uncharacterized protein CANTADRAFT_8412 [Suhomyces tanzawaensis NRRL Y-17324]ODV76823.1 hypothetical protein CANTADRAFT_8412 [Suhomyces tanzawaensis NRRL Y-17324]